ncbi:L,D-transpeptidase [Roseiarcaceae bacterium H3SJ34-1]|uniref:L,D-transpeptidase n=1 Tax=Terripilifer ovatus TaxID=3032367 RepID=UPI003AB921BB|nr:L,D-transpeptidase [Roseiarcaceae bacterium H3SJ34-1]
MFNSRSIVAAVLATAAFAAPALAQSESSASFFRDDRNVRVAALTDPLILGRESPQTTREIMTDPTEQRPGTITIDTQNRYLYLSLPDGRALRYGIGVGRPGFEWKGVARVGRKAEWPSWTPPAEMLKRRPDLPRFMPGGIDNPLGARAMYLYSGGRDLLYRIHGTNEPWSIGEAVSSGCIRMMNEDVKDLYTRVGVGATVVVL